MKYPKRGARRASRPLRKRGGRRRPSAAKRRLNKARKSMPKRQHLQSSLGGLSIDRFVSVKRPNRLAATIKKVGQPNFINVVYPGVLQVEGGLQGASTWYLNCGNDLRRIWASIQQQYVNKQASTGAEYVSSAPDPTPGVVSNASFRVVLESATSFLNIANTSGTPANVELYDIVAKRDIGQVPLNFQGQLATGPQLIGQGSLVLDPGYAWFLGMANEKTTATGYESAALTEPPGYQNLGSTPYQSKLFKDYFKVVRKTNVSLPIGGTHKHYVDLKPNFVFDNDIMAQNNVYAGTSFFTMIVASGVPVVKCPGNTGPDYPLANFKGDATTSAVSLSIIQQVRYKWTWVEDGRENIYFANYINTGNPAGGQTIQPAMVKISDADQVDTQTGGLTGTAMTWLPSECTRITKNEIVG